MILLCREPRVREWRLQVAASPDQRGSATDPSIPFARIVEADSRAICLADARATGCPIVYVNPAYESMTGYHRDEVLGRDFGFLTAGPSDREQLAAICLSMRDGKSRQTVFLGQRKDESSFWGDLSVCPISNDDGEVVLLACYMVDVTAEKKVGTRHVSQDLAPLVQRVPGLTIVDARGMVLHMSSKVTMSLGYGADEFSGKSIFDLVQAEGSGAARAAFAKCLAEPELPVTLNVRCRHRDGTSRNLEMVAINHLSDPRIQGIMLSSRDITDRRLQLDVQLQEALHDTLTGLPNRTLLEVRLKQAGTSNAEHGLQLALLRVDIEQVDEMISKYGTQAKDELVRAVGSRLSGLARDVETAARIDECAFAMLVPGARVASASWAARKVLSTVSQPVAFADCEVQPQVSVGIALSPDHGTEVAQLLQHAEGASRRAWRTGSGFSLETQSKDEPQADRFMLVDGLRQALADNALVLHYQPKVDMRTSRVVGAEALVRWPHAKRGMLQPDQFIAAAEQTGVIAALTLLVARMALSRVVKWHEAKWPLAVSINLSMRTLVDRRLPDKIGDLLSEFKAPRNSFTLEIAESALGDDQLLLEKTLKSLESMGTRLAIDNFGTGFSNLEMLRHLPVRELKIDRTFVLAMHQSPPDAAIVKSIIELGHSLGMVVVAQGVENRNTWEALAQLGCDLAQGYYISRPLTPSELDGWLVTSSFGVASTGLGA